MTDCPRRVWVWVDPIVVGSLSPRFGTPVIAADRGSVREVIRPGRGGIVADGLDHLVEAVEAVLLLDRSVCRQEAERFDSATMARRYLTAYRRLIDNPTAIAIRDRQRQRIRQAS